jgi:ubiquitin-conjugating enzyme E2 M
VLADVAELVSPTGIAFTFPEPNNIMHYILSIKPNDGLYKGAEFKFNVTLLHSYPYDPPKVTCETLVYHPNIDFEGHVCLNILRQDWTPALNLNAVNFGLMTLFLEPNPDDPLNKDAAKLMLDKNAEFQQNVKQSLRGGYVVGRQFPKLLNN